MKNQNRTFAIGIPTINRADLIQETVEKYCRDFPDTKIFIVDNGYQEFDISKWNSNVHITANNKNYGVAESWNILCKKIFDGVTGFSEPCIGALILNDDIYLGKKEDDVKKFVLENVFSLATTTGTWCAFMVMRSTFKTVGVFDSAFYPAYFEDNDYAYRLLLAGIPHKAYEFMNPEIYRNSQTIEKDPSLNYRFEENKKHYIEKWGGEPYKETFLVPWNES